MQVIPILPRTIAMSSLQAAPVAFSGKKPAPGDKLDLTPKSTEPPSAATPAQKSFKAGLNAFFQDPGKTLSDLNRQYNPLYFPWTVRKAARLASSANIEKRKEAVSKVLHLPVHTDKQALQQREVLLKLSNDKDASVRQSLGHKLDQIETDPENLKPETLKTFQLVLNRLAVDESAEVRSAAAEGLWYPLAHDRPATEALTMRLAKDSSPQVRKAVLFSLTHMADTKLVLPILTGLTQDKDVTVRLRSVETIQRLGRKMLPAAKSGDSPQAVLDEKTVLNLLMPLAEEAKMEIRHEIIRQMPRLVSLSDESRATLVNRLWDMSRPEVKEALISSTRQTFKDLKNAAPFLRRYIMDLNFETRRLGAAEVIQLPSESPIKAILMPLIENDPDAEVRRIAASIKSK